MGSSWASFKLHWVKPDIYPLIGVMASALGLGTFATIHTWQNPSVMWDRDLRKRGVVPGEGTEYTPMVSYFKNKSARVLQNDSSVWEASSKLSGPFTVTLVLDEGNEGEDEELTDKAGNDEQGQRLPPPLVEVMDDSAQAINAAINEALADVLRSPRERLQGEKATRPEEKVTV